MDLLAIFLAANVTPWFWEKSKDWAWMPFMQRWSRFAPLLNRVTPFLGMAAVAYGVHWSFDLTGEGKLTVDGFMPDQHKLTQLLLFLVGWGTQQYRYVTTVKAAPNA
jgi:hypothetical protein